MYFSVLLPQINVEFLIFPKQYCILQLLSDWSLPCFRPVSTPRTLRRCRAPTWTRGCPPRATRRPSWHTTSTRRSSRRWGRWCTAATTPATPSTPLTTSSLLPGPATRQCLTPRTSLPTPPPLRLRPTTTRTVCPSLPPSLTPPPTTSPPRARPTRATIHQDDPSNSLESLWSDKNVKNFLITDQYPP